MDLVNLSLHAPKTRTKKIQFATKNVSSVTRAPVPNAYSTVQKASVTTYIPVKNHNLTIEPSLVDRAKNSTARSGVICGWKNAVRAIATSIAAPVCPTAASTWSMVVNGVSRTHTIAERVPLFSANQTSSFMADFAILPVKMAPMATVLSVGAPVHQANHSAAVYVSHQTCCVPNYS